jgi:hypothetical protein
VSQTQLGPDRVLSLSYRWYAEGGGVHWKKYETESKRLGDMGITACWIPRMCHTPIEALSY